ncbi:MAG: dCTP deaminase domain-containing protein [Desulfobacterales bacterium]
MGNKPLEIGTLNDMQIIEMCEKSELIRSNFSVKQVHQACYEIRAGTVYYDLTEGRKRFRIPHDGDILIKPRHMVVIITLEEFNLPSDILGRILTKGAFFSLGLSPVNTYADPGFSGNLGIVLFNSSVNYVRIPTGTSIAKIEFSRLRHPVDSPYSGQHGYQTSIWPIREDLLLTESEIRKDHRVGEPFQELVIQQGELFGNIVKRVFQFERRLLLFAATFLIINFLVLWSIQGTKFEVTAVTIALGIISNLATMIITLSVTNLRRK